jgi:NTE family protein
LSGRPAGGATLALALGAGGARGVAHAAVLRRLLAEGIAPATLVGCSVGGIVAAMYAAAGLDTDELIEGARRLNPAGLLNYALSRWRVPLLSRRALRRSGAIPAYLDRLEAASFARLHHGVRHLGILTFDLAAREEYLVLGGSGREAPLRVAEAVRASAAIPGLFPPLVARVGARRRYLADPGWSTSVPIERAFAPPLRAAGVIAVDLSLRVCLRQGRASYWRALHEACGSRLIVLRPDVRGCGTILSRPGDVDRLIAAGEEAVDRALPRIRALAAAALAAPAAGGFS